MQWRRFLHQASVVREPSENSLKRILVAVHSNALPIINHRNRGGKNNGGDSAGFLPTPLPPIVLSVTSVPTTPATPRSRSATRKSTTFQVKCKVIYPKYSKHWPYTVVHTIDCVCSKILDHSSNHGLFLSLFKLILYHIHWIVYVLAYLSFIFEF